MIGIYNYLYLAITLLKKSFEKRERQTSLIKDDYAIFSGSLNVYEGKIMKLFNGLNHLILKNTSSPTSTKRSWNFLVENENTGIT